MKQLNFVNNIRNKINTKSLANALAEKEDRTFLKGGVEKNDYNNNTYEPYTENRYTGFGDNTNNNNKLSFSQGVGLAKDIKGYTGGGSSSGGGSPWGAIAGVARQGYDTIMDKDGSEYSDLEQSTIYPLQGAATGSALGPWGALGGALYGLGYSFKDDLGLEDNDLLTELIFPIGMGDEHQGLISL